jgi:hypothetical protein
LTDDSQPVNFNAIKPEPGLSAPTTNLTEAEAEEYVRVSNLTAREFEDYEKQRQQTELDDYKAEVANRKRYTTWLFWLMVGWIAIVLAVVIASGVKQPTTTPNTESVLPWWAWLVLTILGVFVGLGVWLPKDLKSGVGGALSEQSRWKRIRIAARSIPVSFFLLPAVGVAMIVASCIVVYRVPSVSMSPPPMGWTFSEWVVAFELSDTVILGLIGGTTANVVGLFYIVARYLFPRRDNGEK